MILTTDTSFLNDQDLVRLPDGVQPVSELD